MEKKGPQYQRRAETGGFGEKKGNKQSCMGVGVKPSENLGKMWPYARKQEFLGGEARRAVCLLLPISLKQDLGLGLVIL
jgi:hypothetical protein